VEDLELTPPIGAFYAGKAVLVTGHTGFKGAWLVRWLQLLGAKVTGFSLAPEPSSLFREGRMGRGMTSILGDLRDQSQVNDVFAASEPEVVFHLGAQSLVRRSFREPVQTYATNVMGTAHVLEAARGSETVRSIVVVTSDKCYENREQAAGYTELDAMGGHDPYSSSKGCAELLTAAYRRSFLIDRGVGVATARAGNVVGGGDRSEDRLVPDIVRALTDDNPIVIRNPTAVRPWQHVLEPLYGYLLLAHHLSRDPHRYAGGWNFGPGNEDALEVGELARLLVTELGRGQLVLAPVDATAPHEAHLLRLDTAKARTHLGWRPRLKIHDAVRLCASWYRRAAADPAAARDLVDEQIQDYCRG
jgi:CDP-glucose 4,6-dehydratase